MKGDGDRHDESQTRRYQRGQHGQDAREPWQDDAKRAEDFHGAVQYDDPTGEILHPWKILLGRFVAESVQGAEGVTPRTFRRTGATAWNDDLASLMSQGAWNDPKTILAHYRRDVNARHRSAFEGAIAKATDEDPDEPKGYA